MASNSRYEADFTTMDGDRWLISIIDLDFSGTATPIEVGMDSFDGFEMNYDGQGEERFIPMLTSKCTVNIAVIASYQSNFETFISDLANADEERFYLLIYSWNGSSWDFEWRGMLLQDLITEDDLSVPYSFQIQASDCIARLKDVEIPLNLSTTSTETFIDLLILVLNETGTKDLWGSAENYLRTAIDWYEQSMYTTAPAESLDPLIYSRAWEQVFVKVEDDKVEIMNCFDVLEYICRLWGARLIMWGGVWNFIQINNYVNDTFTFRNYYKDGTANSYDTGNDFRITDHHRTGLYQYLPVLKRVELNYNYKQSIHPWFSLLPEQDEYEDPITFGSIQGGDDELLVFTGTVEIHLEVADPAPSGDVHRWVFDMLLKVGSYYLTNTNGSLEWSTTTTDRLRFISGYFIEFKTYTRYINISFTTPPIPAGGTGTFEFDKIRLEDEFGDTWIPQALNTATYFTRNFWLRWNVEDYLDEGTVEIYADAGTGIAASTVLELPDQIFGDGPDDYSDGAIQVYDGAAWANSDEEWTVGGDTAGYNINELCCIEVLAGQRSAPKKYIGSIFGADMNALSVIVINSEKYVFMGGTFSANQRTWNAEWFELTVDRSALLSGISKADNPDLPDIINRLGGDDNTRQLRERLEAVEDLKIEGPGSLLTSNYTISDEGEHIFYANPTAGTFNIQLPNYSNTELKSFIIINVDSSTSLTITRDDSADKINGSAANYTLTADTSIQIHNSGIASIGWATIFANNRK